MTPADFPRRVLLAVTGLTPQVVTETLYALAVAPAPTFVPTEIYLLTTAEGAERARLSLLDPATGQFHALCRDYGLEGRIAFAATDIHVIADAAGRPLADIRSPEDNTLAADWLLGHVRRLCADESCALHVSIAGGRKTMGFFAGYALSLFGREQDRLSHVLVSEPFESLTDFYYPPARPRVLHMRDGCPVHTADARIMLAEIPFVRLRDGLPREALRHSAPFAQLVAAAQQGVGSMRLGFDVTLQVVRCAETEVRMAPALFAFYWWLATLRRDDAVHEGFVRCGDMTPNAYLEHYAATVGRHNPKFEAEQSLLANGFEAEFFQEKCSKINRQLRKALSLSAAPFLIRTSGKRPLTRYGLGLPPTAISR